MRQTPLFHAKVGALWSVIQGRGVLASPFGRPNLRNDRECGRKHLSLRIIVDFRARKCL